MVKPWYTSKTVWVNALALLGTISVSLGWDLGLTADVQASLVVGIMAVVNIILRFVTDTKIK